MPALPSRQARRFSVSLAMVLAAVVLAAAACAGPGAMRGGEGPHGSDGEPQDASQKEPHGADENEAVVLAPVDSCDALRGWLADALVEQWAGYDGHEQGGVAEARSDGGGASAGPSSFTGTNNQEVGVDEMDFVKTDGTYIYILQGNTFSIVRAFPADEAETLASLRLPGTGGGALFLHGDRVVVASQVLDADGSGEAVEVPFPAGSVRLTFIDVSARSAPVIERHIDIEGRLVSGRLVGSQAWFVTRHSPSTAWEIRDEVFGQITQWPTVGDNSIEEQLAARTQMREMLRPLVLAALEKRDVERFLPQLRVSVEGEQAREPEALASCARWMRPGGMPQPGTLAVTQIDLSDADGTTRTSGVLASGWQVYASDENLYVVRRKEDRPRSQVHKFALDATTGPRYQASGTVDGWLLNAFSMSEHDGFLRVATTTWNTTLPDGSTLPGGIHLFVLEEHEGRLSTVGALKGLAPGEQLNAARMMGERGYLQMSRQVEPLYTLDLRDPRKPRVVGEIKLPGRWVSLYPLGEDHLLIVGMEGITGVAVSVFDVEDVAEPKLVHQHAISHRGWRWGEALYDHHAYTFHDGVLAVPASWADPHDAHDWFTGIQVLRVDAEEGIEAMGQVDHDQLAVQACVAYYTQLQQRHASQHEANDDVATCAQPGHAAGWVQMRRSIFIDDTLVSISTAGIKFSPLAALDETLASLAMPVTR